MVDGESIKVLFYAMGGFFVGLFFFYKGFVWQKQKQVIENLPTSKIRSLAMGLVEVSGKAVLKPDGVKLKSPFTNKPCVYYKYMIEEYRKQGKNSSWAVIGSGKDYSKFYLQDDTGKVLVNPTGANIDIPHDNIFTSNIGKEPPLSVKNFINKQNIRHESWLGINKRMRYTEWFIEPGDNIYIIGTADDNPELEEGTAQHNVDDIMIQKGSNNPFYYISDKGEKEVLNSFKWKVIGGLFGGGTLTVACFAAILILLRGLV